MKNHHNGGKNELAHLFSRKNIRGDDQDLHLQSRIIKEFVIFVELPFRQFIRSTKEPSDKL
jgi:hypothetical protein